MINKEKLELYNKAKDAYYNGEEIMTDYEFDQLEKELGLENKSTIGSKHNPSYTVKHPYIMGSLSKVQIHKDKDGNIDWDKYFSEMRKFNKIDGDYIITPKYDGCSFEIYCKNGNVEISSRGDGNFGKDLKKHIYNLIPYKLFSLQDEFTLRGEVLVNKKTFEKKYSEKFTNPRSFVSGVLNNDYSNDKEFKDKLNDLSLVIYDYRIKFNGIWKDYDWTEILQLIKSDSSYDTESINQITNVLPKFYHIYNVAESSKNLEYIYNEFANYRIDCEYALDGFVIKPTYFNRENNITERRPKDCVAIKFIPMLQETEVTNITWNLGKTGEFTPIIWVKPVEMDGRIVQKCSGHNLGYLKEKGISIGAKIIMSLAGDIIPFMYKVTQKNKNGDIPMPDNYEYYNDDIHLMAILNEEDHARLSFISSSNALGIPNIGNESANKIFDYLIKVNDKQTLDFFNESIVEYKYNILECSNEDIFFGLGGGKLGNNAKKSFSEFIKTITLKDIIKSCNFKLCGGKIADACEEYILNGNADFSHFASEGYKWVLDNNSPEYNKVNNILNYLGKTVDDFKESYTESKEVKSSQIPVILTGEPNNYNSKGEFLKLNPQYRQTGSWKEVQIVFTNSLDSNTGKMKKAREKNIKIELY